jgi:hypothetical protein
VHGQGYRLAQAPRPETRTALASARPLAIKWAALALLAFLLVMVLVNGVPHGIKHFFKHMFS